MDALAFPVLAGSALTEAVRFLFDRAGAVLDRRAGRVPAEEPEQVSGQAQPLLVRPTELTDTRIQRLSHAHGALRVYLSRPEFLQGEDADLRELLGLLRSDLEEIYGCRLAFGNEEQESRPGVEISQRADFIDGSQVGVRSRGITERGRARVKQDAKTVGKTGEQVGVEVDGTIG
ncbi:hypothetical protein [Streptomyces sp. MK37H]|uniref:hypothetical protein n=1 Tax=Streptomyces sp. MK37H TaxID=2699117 RepID=UPI001B37BD23|nr:hypothetical protein [Streptomyces sp. MK37H]MBP8533117.1 hypothetical protein [Streptomyces sp. MK37H]